MASPPPVGRDRYLARPLSVEFLPANLTIPLLQEGLGEVTAIKIERNLTCVYASENIVYLSLYPLDEKVLSIFEKSDITGLEINGKTFVILHKTANKIQKMVKDLKSIHK